MHNRPGMFFITALLFSISSLLTSCTSLLTTTMINPAVNNLQKQSDIELVCEGSPSFLLMVDSLLESNPQNKALLVNGTQAYSGATAALVACNAADDRVAALSSKARLYGKRLLSFYLPLENSNSDMLDSALSKLTIQNGPHLFWGAFGWLSWVQQQQGSPASMADLVVIEKIMKRLLELDETIENGSPHLFFGALYGAKPALIGGDPERSRYHFERALKLSDRSSLIVHTTFAETYGRMTFDKVLHDALLHEVLDFHLADAPSRTLINQIAKRKAQQLLDERFFD